MNWYDKTLEFLGLDNKERDILLSLDRLKSVQDISRTLNYPRTTIAYIVKKLVDRKLIQKVKVNCCQSACFH